MNHIINESHKITRFKNIKIIIKNNKCLHLKYYYLLYFFLFSIFLMTKVVDKYKLHKPIPSLTPYIKFLKDCKKLISYERRKVFNEYPFISVCIPALNMEKYIERIILTVLNQSFQDFEIIVVDDYSSDETPNILKRLNFKDKRIKFISHPKNLGVYASRTEAIRMSKGKYIILLDPDDMILNENLFQELYDYNYKYNLDIIEFVVYQQKEGNNTIYLPNNHLESHYHNFSKNIIQQPELSNLLFYNPGTTQYNKTICRNIWNKMIRKEPLVKMIEYIGFDYYYNFVVTADDMIMNIITYQFANNYSNIELPGYMYNIRKLRMSRGNEDINLIKIRSNNHYFYFFQLYKYIKDFKKDRNFFLYELKDLQHYMRFIKTYNLVEYLPKAIDLFKEIINDEKASKELVDFAKELVMFYEK